MPEPNADILLELIVERTKSDEQFKKSAETHYKFATLMEQPAWAFFQENLADTEERIWAGFRARMMDGEEVSQREIDQAIGFVKGVRSVLSLPERIHKNFDRVLDRVASEALQAPASPGYTE